MRSPENTAISCGPALLFRPGKILGANPPDTDAAGFRAAIERKEAASVFALPTEYAAGPSGLNWGSVKPMRNLTVRSVAARLPAIIAGALLLCLAAGCPPADHTRASARTPLPAGQLQAVNLSDPAHPVANDQPIVLSAARNEWTNFVVQVSLPGSEGYWLHVHSPQLQSANAALSTTSFDAYQILPMPVDMDRAGYVRHTGQSTATSSLPRALLPQTMDADGRLNLSGLRNPSNPADPHSRAGGPGAAPAMLWLDVHIPKNATAGEYQTTVDLMAANGSQPMASIPLRLTVYDFDLPDERHLHMVGRLGWDRLEKLYPEQFEAVTPSWINRREPRYGATVRTLDHLVALSEKNRANLVVPALKPVVKWPPVGEPDIDWHDFDSIVRPWFTGDAFADRIGLRYWPLPPAEMLDRFDRSSQIQYWSAAATHFDQNDWLGLTAISLDKFAPGRVNAVESIQLSAEAAEILRAHPRVRVLAPLEDGQIQLANAANPNWIDRSTTGRLLAASPSLVSTPAQPWPLDAAAPGHWLRTDLPGLVPYAGAGCGERDARVWAWLAFIRHIKPVGRELADAENFILWDSTLPQTSDAAQPADPNELAWFYPGKWFGVDAPVPTMQLKWLRRAEQDYEYLLLAEQRGELINALQMARLITKPVEIQPGQDPDAVYSLMSGTTSQQTWDEAQRLLADTILLRKPGQQADANKQQELYIRTLQWAAPQERPLLLGRSAQWGWSEPAANMRNPGTWVDLHLGLDIYNASETSPDLNRLRWAHVPVGWQIRPQELDVPRLNAYRVQRATMRQRFNLDRVSPAAREPLELEFIHGFTKVTSPLKLVLPVAVSDRKEGRLSIDGTLDDWADSDAIQDGPLVKMFDRPALQRQELQRAATPSRIYTAWARENFYLAFSLGGQAPDSHRTQNFVDYQQRRAWGEDLCEVLIQPVFANNNVGPVVHLVCKTNGGVWVERKLDPHGNPNPWKPVEGIGVRYASTMHEGDWRGEVAIPWSVIAGPTGDTPTLLRFNFTQHRAQMGESASWAGPVDFGRDDSFMGLLYLRTPGQPGANDIVLGEGGSGRP
jgi:hypothetical protein